MRGIAQGPPPFCAAGCLVAFKEILLCEPPSSPRRWWQRLQRVAQPRRLTRSWSLHQPGGIKLCHSPLGLPFSWHVRKEFVCCCCCCIRQSRAPRAPCQGRQRARMIAVSFKCRCQILRRLAKGNVFSFLFIWHPWSSLPEAQPDAFTFQYDQPYNLLSDNKELGIRRGLGALAAKILTRPMLCSC